MPSPLSATDLQALLPVVILTAGGLLVLLSEVFGGAKNRGYQAVLTALFSVGASIAAVLGPRSPIFGRQAIADGFSIFVTVTVCVGLALSAFIGAAWLHARQAERGEFYALALFGASGMSLLGMASDLLVAFIAIEIMSLSTYCLVAFQRLGKRPSEAALKYFLLGSFSSAILLYGVALVYGATGSTLFSTLERGGATSLLPLGLGLIIVGLAFKVGAVPLHAWVPDVYEGAPTPVTAFMAAGVKTAAFALLARLMLAVVSLPRPVEFKLFGLVSTLAVLTMLFGNLLALPQRSVKRMLAYSSIAHAGYLLVGVCTIGITGGIGPALSSILFYLASYTVAVVGAFGVIAARERRGRTLGDESSDAWDLSRFAGLGRKHPALAFAMSVFLVSLAGIPPTAGFIGKLLIFEASVKGQLYPLAVIGLVASALGAYYYLRVVVYMYMREPEGSEEASRVSPALSVALAVAVAAVVALGILPEAIAAFARSVAVSTGF